MKEEFIKIRLPKDFDFWTASWPMRMSYVLQELIKMDKEGREKLIKQSGGKHG